MTNYVQNTDVATASKLGLVKGAQSLGTFITGDGAISLVSANKTLIDQRTNNYCPITPKNLVYAVESVVGGHVTLTQGEYDALVEAGTVDDNTYYYIKEE